MYAWLLLDFTPFTGCDTVSAFEGRGKLGALKLHKESETYKKAFKHLGEEWKVSTNLFDKLQEFVCRMYTSTVSDVNELHHHLSCSKRGQVDTSLPPRKDCLYMHILRANYQAAIWRCCLASKPVLPDLNGFGWTIDVDGSISIEWVHGSPAPEAVLQLVMQV